MTAPRAPRKEPHVLSLAEVQKLLAAAEGTPWFVWLYMAVATSMRTSELFGLRWPDIDTKQGFPRVRQQVAKTDDGPAFGDPKSAAGKRRIDLPTPLLKLLRDHRKSQGDNPNDLVFPNEIGSFQSKDNFRKRVWLLLRERAGLSHATFYSLRHTGNSLLIAGGHSMKLALSRLGQSTPAITLQTYAFLRRDRTSQRAELLGRLLKPNGGTLRGTKLSSARNGQRRASKKPLRHKGL
jgi:integrase